MNNQIKQMAQLTCKRQCCVSTDSTSVNIGGVTIICAHVRLSILVMYNPEEEQLGAVQQHAVRGRVFRISHNTFTVSSVPCDCRRGITLRFAVELCRFIFGDVVICWVFNDSWVGQVTCNDRRKKVV